VRVDAGTRWARAAADRADWAQALAGWTEVLALAASPDASLTTLAGVGTGAAAAALGLGDPTRAWAGLEAAQALQRRHAWGGVVDTVDSLELEGTAVAITVTPWRCDALLRGPAGDSHVPLPGLTEREAVSRAAALWAALRAPSRASSKVVLDGLAWLWDTVTGPVLSHLGHTQVPDQARWPRVWWLPTGPLAGLPLHAAGHHDDEVSLSRRVTVDRVVSSYAPSLHALAQAHGRPRSPLPPEPDVVVDDAATVATVRDALPRAGWAHFACHGVLRADPGESQLGGLPLRELAGLRLDHAHLAYLSGCAGEPDQTAAALHQAGFPHVVATLWPPGASLALSPAELTAGVGPAYAVHEALRRRRDHYPHHPYLWASHVHLGP